MSMKWKKLMTNPALEQDCATGIGNFNLPQHFDHPMLWKIALARGKVKCPLLIHSPVQLQDLLSVSFSFHLSSFHLSYLHFSAE